MKRLPKSTLLLTLTLVVMAILAGCSQKPGTLEGTVTSSASGQPVEGATITLYALSQPEGDQIADVYAKGEMLAKELTAQDGTYSLNLKANRYIVEVWVEGYDAGSRMVEVTSGRTHTVDFDVD